MKRLTIASLMALGASALGVYAQQPQLSPLPQQAEWGAKAFDKPAAIAITGEKDADSQAVAALKKAFASSASGVKVTIGEKGDAAVASVADRIPAQAEGYYLSVTPSGVTIAGADEAGTFYGVQTFLQMAAQPEVMAVEMTDWPVTAQRGIIEGFYGNPWSFDDRCSQFDFYGANKLNVYIYGPKDDPYHHSRWYEPYPEAEAQKMAELVKRATDNKVKFVWAMHPSNSIASADDKKKALAKFDQMYGLGVRAFAIFFDDISANSVDQQISYLNFLTDEFVKKHDDVEPLIVCPTQYNKGWSSGDYLPKMGQGLYPEIRIMWTGNSVVDMIDKGDCEWFKGQTGRDPYIWLNYPVNDYGGHSLLMGPLYGNEAEATRMVSGFTANPMQYAEASKVALYSLADFVWNPDSYDSDASWEGAIRYLAPGHEKAFRQFCIDNVDVYVSSHGLRRWGESPEFKAILDAQGDASTSNISAYAPYFATMTATGQELLANTDQKALMDEIKEFIQYYTLQGQRGTQLTKLYEALGSKDNDAFIDAYKQYVELTDRAEKIISRDFEGSIQKVWPRTATLYVEPFIVKGVGNAIAEFKASGAQYPQGLFPEQVVENGTYYIKVNGKWLSNRSASAGYPTLRSDQDNVNPNRQVWRITLEPETGRYRIISEQDQRYVNEIGNFGTNPYNVNWNTYVIYRHNDRYAIQNAGSGGSGFWNISGSRLGKTANGEKLDYDKYIFEIIPTDGADQGVTIVDGHLYMITDQDGRLLTNTDPEGRGGNPTFEEVAPARASSTADDTRLWKLGYDEEMKAYSLRSAADNRYVSERGVFGVNAYYNDWNTYHVTLRGNSAAFLIMHKAADQLGDKYWTVNGNAIAVGGTNVADHYAFKLIDATAAGIANVSADMAGMAVIITAGAVEVTAPEGVRRLTITSTDGRSTSTDGSRIATGHLSAGVYVLTVATPTRTVSRKIQLR